MRVDPSEPAGSVPKPSRDVAIQVHQLIRNSILTGELAAGEILSQVELAARYGVTRGPIREALRILEGEGLVISEINQRSRVASASISDLEQTYAMAVVIEALITRIAAPQISAAAIEDLRRILDEMNDPSISIPDWETLHLRFHEVVRSPAGGRLVTTAESLHLLGERYRWLYYGTRDERGISGTEHRALLEAIAAGDAELAAERMGWHVGRTGITMIGQLDPTHDPAAVRTAVSWSMRRGRSAL